MDNTAIDHGNHFTYADYLTWPEGERWELIDGVAYNMTPAPSTLHQRFVLEIAGQLRASLKGKPCEPFVAPFDVRLPDGDESENDIQTVVQPDISVICDATKLDKAGCLGAPDFVIEIISPSTARKDQLTKTELYERHKVKEYWIIHPLDGLLTIRVLDENGRYSPARFLELKDTVEVAALPGLAIDLDAVGQLREYLDAPAPENPNEIRL